MDVPAIEIQQLVVKYGGKPAVDGLDLTVPAGTVFGFLGPNGSGKTTTIKTLLGMRRADAGSARVLGYDVQTQSREVRAHVGYVSEVNSLYDYMTIPQIIAFFRDTARTWNPPLVDRYVELFHLPRADPIGHFSKGMKSQLALCLALGGDPQLLILDEPTVGLDPLARREVLNRLVGEIAASGKTVFFSSHILAEVETVADWVGIIRKGKLVVSAELDRLKRAQKVLRLTYDTAPLSSELESLRALPEVVSAEQEGRTVRLLGRGSVEELDRLIHTRPIMPRSIESVALNLDDLFMLYIKDRPDGR